MAITKTNFIAKNGFESPNISIFGAGVFETKVALTSDVIDISTGSIFTKTISAPTTFSVTNVAQTGKVCSFILELTNGGSQVITWWAGVNWASAIAPVLTSAGKDIISFYTHDGGTTWNGLLIGKDVK